MSRWRSFLLVPPVATLVWYVFMLAALLAVNGRLRWRTDVLAMGLGALLLGLPTATVITGALAFPAYLLAHRFVTITATIAIAAGALIGLLTWIIVAGPSGESTVLSPVRAPLIGAVTAAVWWYANGERAASSQEKA